MSTSRPHGSSSPDPAKTKGSPSGREAPDAAPPDYDALDASDEAEKAADIKQTAREGKAEGR